MLPLGGCLLTGDKPEPALDIPHRYDGGVAESARSPRPPAAARLVARVPLARTDRDRRRRARRPISTSPPRSRASCRPTRRRASPARRCCRSVDLNGNATHSRASQTSGGTAASRPAAPSATTCKRTLTASYEIDFWGKNRVALRAAEETAVASRFDREVVGAHDRGRARPMPISRCWRRRTACASRAKISPAPRRVLNLIEQRLAAGTASALETAQQESVVATRSAPQSRRSSRRSAEPQRARGADGALAGARARSAAARCARIAYPRVTPGLPSELLAQRPDIREAEAQARRRQRQRRQCARAVPAEHHADRRRRLSQRGAQDAVPAGIGVLHARRRPDAADLRGRPADRQSRPAKGRQDELLQNLSQGGDLRLRRRREGARRHPPDRAARAAAGRGGRRARARPSTLPSSGCARAPSTWSPCCRRSRLYIQAEDLLVQARLAHVQAIVEPLSGARRRLAAETTGSCRCTVKLPKTHSKAPPSTAAPGARLAT